MDADHVLMAKSSHYGGSRRVYHTPTETDPGSPKCGQTGDYRKRPSSFADHYDICSRCDGTAETGGLTGQSLADRLLAMDADEV